VSSFVELFSEDADDEGGAPINRNYFLGLIFLLSFSNGLYEVSILS